MSILSPFLFLVSCLFSSPQQLCCLVFCLLWSHPMSHFVFLIRLSSPSFHLQHIFFPSGLSSDSPAGNLVVFMLFIRSLYCDRVIQCMCTVCHWPNNWPKCVINHLCDNDSNQDNSRPELHNQSVYTLTFTQKHFNQCLTDPGSHIRSLKVYIHRCRDASHN